MQNIRVLFIEDNPLDVELLIRHIRKSGFDLDHELIDSIPEISSILRDQKFDVCICDYNLSGFSGLDAIHEIRNLQTDLPVILVSGTVPDEQAIDAVLAGAKDYVLKDNLKRLVPAIKREVGALQQRTQKKKSDQLLEAVFNSPTGIRITDQNRIIIKVNDAYAEMMGYKKEELLGKCLDDLIPENRVQADKKHYKEFIENFRKDKTPDFGTYRDIKKDGSYIDLMIKSNVVEDDNDLFVVTTFQDVSEVFKYKTLFEESSRIAKLGGWEIDIATGKEVWTKGVYEIYGLEENEFNPQVESDKQFHTEESWKLVRNSVDNAKEHGEPFDIEVEIVDAKGNHKWCRGTGKPVFEDDKVVKLIGSLQDITERKSRELELKRSQEKYKFLFDRSPNPMVIFDFDTDKILDVNDAAISKYGYSRNEFLNLQAIDLRPKKYHSWYKENSAVFNLDSDEIRFFSKVNHIKKNGEEMLVDVFSRHTKIDDKNATIVVFNDITDKSKYEQELLRTNNLLTALIKNAPIGLITVDRQGKVEDLWNPKAEEIFGWKKEEVLGKKLPYVPDEKLDEFNRNLKIGFEEKRSFIVEIKRVRKNGETVHLREFIAPLLNEDGSVMKLMMLSEDVTEKKYVENALIGSERKYRNLVEASHDLVWRIDREGNFNFINNASKTILGYTPDELIGKSFIPLISSEKAEQTIGVHQEVIAGAVFESFPLEMITKDGEVRYLSGKAYPMRDENGVIIGCSGTATDITHITHYQKQLEESLAEKEVLIKEIHHRVKNNLAVISGLFVLQSMHVDDEETLSILKESQSRIKSIAKIHERLYTNEIFSSIEIKSYLENLIIDIAETYKRSDKEIEVKVEGKEISLTVNQAVPFGILANELVINAFKYAFSEKDKGVIRLVLKEHEGKVTFSVGDDGIGLPDNFEMSELNSLGMTLIRTLANQLEADFSWKTKRNQGVKFQIVFMPEKITKATWIQKSPKS